VVWEEDFNKELKKLKNALNRMLIRSKEFQIFRKKLKEWNLDSDISFQMHIVDKEDRSFFKRNGFKKNGNKITEVDLAFLKKNGIKWD